MFYQPYDKFGEKSIVFLAEAVVNFWEARQANTMTVNPMSLPVIVFTKNTAFDALISVL